MQEQYTVCFKEIIGQLIVRNALIHDFKLKTENSSYVSLKISNQVTPDTINSLDDTGEKVWQYNGHIFVSRDLKNKMRAFDPQNLRFDPGFSYFG